MRNFCTVVIVNWNSGDRLRDCVRSIPPEFEVVIVDNASSDSSLAGLSPEDGSVERNFFQSTGDSEPKGDRERAVGWRQTQTRLATAGTALAASHIIRNPRNEGFARAANYGAAASSREFLLFLNPDVSFAAQDSADAMLCLLREKPQAAAATGHLYPPSREGLRRHAESLIRPLPTLFTALSDVLFFDELRQLLAGRDSPVGRLCRKAPREVEPIPARVGQAPGACLLVRRKVFEQLGGFDPSFYPAWFEDVDFCKRLTDLGMEIFYHPRSRFQHEGGYSAHRLGRSKFNRIYYGNMIRYFQKHHGHGVTAVLKVAVPLGNALRRLFNFRK